MALQSRLPCIRLLRGDLPVGNKSDHKMPGRWLYFRNYRTTTYYEHGGFDAGERSRYRIWSTPTDQLYININYPMTAAELVISSVFPVIWNTNICLDL